MSEQRKAEILADLIRSGAKPEVITAISKLAFSELDALHGFIGQYGMRVADAHGEIVADSNEPVKYFYCLSCMHPALKHDESTGCTLAGCLCPTFTSSKSAYVAPHCIKCMHPSHQHDNRHGCLIWECGCRFYKPELV